MIPRMSTSLPPAEPLSREGLHAALTDVIDQLAWLLAAAPVSQRSAVDLIIFDAEHAVTQLAA